MEGVEPGSAGMTHSVPPEAAVVDRGPFRDQRRHLQREIRCDPSVTHYVKVGKKSSPLMKRFVFSIEFESLFDLRSELCSFWRGTSDIERLLGVTHGVRKVACFCAGNS